MSKIGLFFGSFNPVHYGHMIIAGYMAEFTQLEKVWMVVTPQNPLKPKNTLLADYHRLELVNLAIGDHPKLASSDIEFKLEKPSYTVKTLAYLSEKFPQHNFSLIMGSDNLENFSKWKNYESILENYEILVYPRPGYSGGTFAKHPNVTITEAPLVEISSTFIRQAVKNKKNVSFLMPEPAFKFMSEMHFYEK